MKRKNTAFIISGIFMILASWCAIAMAVLVFISKISSADFSLAASAGSCALILVWAIINLYLGFAAIATRKKNRRLKKFFALGIISIVIFIIQSLLSAANGIIAIHLLILLVCGFVIPCFHLFICRSRM